MIHFHNKHQDPFEFLHAEHLQEYILESDSEKGKELECVEEEQNKTKPYKPIRNFIFYTLTISLMLLGFVASALGFIDVNLFGIELKPNPGK